MLETLKTLRFVHLTLVAASAAILILGLNKQPDFTSAISDLEALRVAAEEGDDAFYRECDLEAGKKVNITKDDLVRLLREVGLQDSIAVAPGFKFETFGFCDGPPVASSLESYENFIRTRQAIGALEPSRGAVAKILTALAKRGASGDKPVLTGMACRVPEPPPELPPARLRELLRKMRSIEEEHGSHSPAKSYLFFTFADRHGESVPGEPSCEDRGGSNRYLGLKWIAARQPQLISSDLAMTPRPLSPTGNDALEPPPRSDIFPRLRPFWSAIRAMTIDDAIAHLEDQREGQATQLNVLGLNLPSPLLDWAAPLVTFVLLAYVKVNLGHLLSLLESDVGERKSFPWFVLYPDRLSKVMTWSSLVAFPLASNLVLLLGPRAGLHHLTVGGAIAIPGLFLGCCLLSVQTARQLRRLNAAR